MANDRGLVLSKKGNYDPWGWNAAGTPRIGFTGEYQGGGLVYLRARWYNPTTGTLLGRDPFEGNTRQPYSQHPFQYGYSNPVSNTDPTGMCVAGDSQCEQLLKSAISKLKYEPEDIDRWNTPELERLLYWFGKGIRFEPVPPIECSDPRDQREPPWRAVEIASMIQGLDRIETVVQAKTSSGLGLSNGVLSLYRSNTSRQDDGAIGGGYVPNLIRIYQNTKVHHAEKSIETLLHEVGHSVDDNAFGQSFWSKNSSEWSQASGWKKYPDRDAWNISDIGRKGAVTEYALRNPVEDFAETFQWYIEDGTGNKVDFLDTNRFNAFGNEPNRERIDAITVALGQLN